MNELFNQDGCLTDYALSALIHDKPLDELERLELSEHLSFCDACIERYTAMLCFAVLFWNLGVFDFQINDKNRQTFDVFSNSTVSFSEKTTRFTDGISAALNQWIYSFNFERGSNHEEK